MDLVTQCSSEWKLFIFIINSTTDAFENFTMVILSSLLASGPNSPFYQSLIAPNIGSDYSPGVGWVYYTLLIFRSVSMIDICFLKLSCDLNQKKVKKPLIFVKVLRQMVVINTISSYL